MRGRKPKPISRQIAEGDTRKRGVRQLKAQIAREPKPARGLPDCPPHLAGRAREAWALWREELAAMKLDARPDAMMLEGACVAYGRAVDADMMITEKGIILSEPVMTRSGEQVGERLRSSPAIAVSNASWKQVRSFCSDFGLSPVSRTRLTIEKPDNGEKELMKMLSAPREPRKERVQ